MSPFAESIASLSDESLVALLMHDDAAFQAAASLAAAADASFVGRAASNDVNLPNQRARIAGAVAEAMRLRAAMASPSLERVDAAAKIEARAAPSAARIKR